MKLTRIILRVCGNDSDVVLEDERGRKIGAESSNVVCVFQEKGSLAGGSYATTGKTSARSDLSPVFGEFELLLFAFFCIVNFSRAS